MGIQFVGQRHGYRIRTRQGWSARVLMVFVATVLALSLLAPFAPVAAAEGDEEEQPELALEVQPNIALQQVAEVTPLVTPEITPVVTAEPSLELVENLRPDLTLQVTPEIIEPLVTPEATLDALTPEIVVPLITPEGELIEPPMAPAAIEVHKFVCPEGFAAYAALLSELQANCGPAPDGISFSVAPIDSAIGLVREAVGGFVSWEGLAPDQLVVQEFVPEGYGEPVVFCTSSIPWGPITDLGHYISSGGSITHLFEPGERLRCDWYNVPLDQDGSITIHKWTCTPGFDLIFGGDVGSECTQPTNGVKFLLDGPGGLHLESDTGDSIDGAVTFVGLSGGSYAITEQFPDGTASAFILSCAGEGVLLPLILPLHNVIDGEPYIVELPAGTDLTCHWYNVPEEDDVVIIHKWRCPEATDAPSLSLIELQTLCAEAMNDVSFNLVDATGSAYTGVSGSDGAPAGQTSFIGIAEGAFTLAEDVPDGYGEPVVFCEEDAVLNGDVEGLGFIHTPELVMTTDGVYTGENPAGYQYRMECQWFNVPVEDDNSLVVHKYVCPDGYDPSGVPLYTLFEECSVALEGIDFRFVQGAFDDTRATQADGTITWDGLPLGPYTLTELVPAGYGDPAVFCGFTAYHDGLIYDGFPMPVETPGATFNGTIEIPNTDAFCFWFNVPEEHDDDGKLMVRKYWCDGTVYTEAACEVYRDGAEFRLTVAEGSGGPLTFTTGVTGRYEIVLPAGTRWYLEEVDRTWCYASSDALDTTGAIEIDEGKDSVVKVFNCGKQPPKDTPVVTTFPNTGTGSAATLLKDQPVQISGWLALLAALPMSVALGFLTLRNQRAAMAHASCRVGGTR